MERQGSAGDPRGQGAAECPGLPLRASGCLMQGSQAVVHGGVGAEGVWQARAGGPDTAPVG
jgi:hypothetical protein